MNAVQKLRQLVGAIQANKSPADVKGAWELAERLLMRSPATASDVDRACQGHDVTALDALVKRLEDPGPDGVGASAAASSVPEGDLDAALRAFRKRLKVSRLADESKLRGRRLTSGRASEIDAIVPPTDFPSQVWQELARLGRLRHAGQGFYALP